MKRFLEQELIKWKDLRDHHPLLLRGARQVGKSYLVEHFGKDHFENLVTVDFERRPDLKRCFETREPSEILKRLEIVLQQKISPGKTLLFFDEIQECPDALVSLRYFRELLPEQHLIAAGSLLEFLLHDERYSFPVGRVEFLYLRPLSFLEFLSVATPISYERIQTISLQSPANQVEHEELLKWVQAYFFVGGMPAAVHAFLENNSFLDGQRVHQRILQAYESDFGKYASLIQHKYLQKIFQKAPAIIGEVLKYSNIDRETRSRDLKPALELLTKAGLLQQVFATTASGLPLSAHILDHRFKLFYLDIGLLQSATHVDAEDFWQKELLQINEGKLAEQYVSQELIACRAPFSNQPLLYWEREKGGDAEIDFVTSVDSQIIPIEVKAGSSGSLRSLHSFLNLKQVPLGVRISEHPLSLNDTLLSIPLYLAHAFQRLVCEAKRQR
jgi:predicted AAA+ superfamily ATPase